MLLATPFKRDTHDLLNVVSLVVARRKREETKAPVISCRAEPARGRPMEVALESVVPLRWRSSFAAARTALCEDDVATARPLFEEMAEALPSNVEVRLHAAWAHARLAKSMSDRERNELEDLARQALGARQSLALPLCILAHAAIRRGELRVARNLFRRAAEEDPALVDARRGFRAVETKLLRASTERTRGNELSFADPARFVLALFVVLIGVAAALAKTVS